MLQIEDKAPINTLIELGSSPSPVFANQDWSLEMQDILF